VWEPGNFGEQEKMIKKLLKFHSVFYWCLNHHVQQCVCVYWCIWVHMCTCVSEMEIKYRGHWRSLEPSWESDSESSTSVVQVPCGARPSFLCLGFYLNPCIAQWRGDYAPHFTDEKAETQRVEVRLCIHLIHCSLTVLTAVMVFTCLLHFVGHTVSCVPSASPPKPGL
jgi:hypothetical protein